jgi:hypothetical protein
MLQVLRGKHRGHAAATDFPFDLIAVGDGGAYSVLKISHEPAKIPCAPRNER